MNKCVWLDVVMPRRNGSEIIYVLSFIKEKTIWSGRAWGRAGRREKLLSAFGTRQSKKVFPLNSSFWCAGESKQQSY